MIDNDYDIVVVGAGPAGSTAARRAAENGSSVLMVDKRRELGVPVQCGEALSGEVLDELGLEVNPRWTANEIDATKLVSPSGKVVEIEQQTSVSKVGYILDRKVFDRDLAVRAVREGADILTSTFVDGLIEEDGRIKGVSFDSQEADGEVRADLIIAADGVMSRVGRWAGFDTNLGPEDLESGSQFKLVNVEIESKSSMEFHFGSDIAPGGYAWIFPRGDDVANVGIGVLPSRSEKPSIDYLRGFVDSKPELSDGRIYEINVGGVPVSGPLDETVKDDIMLVGDAARQVNSLTGGGIDWSMRAGDIAGEVAARAISEGDTSKESLEEYEERWRERMGEKLEYYYQSKEILLDLSDDELDDLADTLNEVDFEEISLTKMIEVIAKDHPELLTKIEEMFDFG